MYLELNPHEEKALDRMLNRYLSDLQNEIQHTDSRDFKEGLKHEVEVLAALRSKLEWDREEVAQQGLS